MPVAVLTVICVVVAILLAVVNHFTAPEIAKNAERKVNESLYAVLDGADGFDEIKNLDEYEGKPKTVVAAHKDKGGSGYVIVLETSTSYTSGAAMSITVGIGTDGAVKGATVTSYSETKDFGKETYPKTFVGLTSDDIDTSNGDLLVSGVTYSSKAFKAAIKDALEFVKLLGGAEPIEPTPETLPKTDAEIIELAKALVGEGADLEDVTPTERDLVKRVYKDKGGKGYVAYLVVMSQYGTPETETLVHFTNGGKLSKTSKVVWKPSDANPEYGYNPPAADVVDAFYAKLADKSFEEFKSVFTGEDVELVSGVTKTSKNLVASIVEAFEKVEELIANDMPRVEDEVKQLAAALVGEGASLINVTPDETKYIKRIYKDEKTRGYVAYLVVISQYGTPETETLVHFNASGRIAGVNKLVWKPSDANPEYGYNPPAMDVVDAFYAKFDGKNSTEFKTAFTGEGVELVSGVTKTSKNLVESIVEAFGAVDKLIYEDMPTSEATVKALATTCLEGITELEEIAIGNCDYVRRLYVDKGGKGLVAYVVVISQYGTPETETLIHADETGKIVAINPITWKPSDANPEYGYNPPAEDVVNAFYEKIPGNTLETMKANFTGEGVELVAGVTKTSKNLVASIIEGLEVINENLPEPPVDTTPRTVGIVILAVALLSVAAVVVIKIVRRRKVR